MAEKTKNLSQPAQARLLKLKQDLKEKNKMKLEGSSTKMSPQKRKSSPKGGNKTNQKNAISPKQETQNEKKRKKTNNAVPVNEAHQSHVPKKRKSSSTNLEHSPSKLPNISGSPKENHGSLPEMSVGGKIKKQFSSLCDKLSYLTGYKQKEKYTISKKASQVKNAISNEHISPKILNMNNFNQSSNSVSQNKLSQTTKNISDFISDKNNPPETEARNLYKRKNTLVTSQSNKNPEVDEGVNNKWKHSRFSEVVQNSLLKTAGYKAKLMTEDRFSKDNELIGMNKKKVNTLFPEEKKSSFHQNSNLQNPNKFSRATENISDIISVKSNPPETETIGRNLYKRKNTVLIHGNNKNTKVDKSIDTKCKNSKLPEFDQNSIEKKVGKGNNAKFITENRFSKDKVRNCDYKSKLNYSKKERQHDFGNENVFINDIDNLDNDIQMEWEPTKDNILRNTRNEIDASEEMMDWQDVIFEDIQNEKGGKRIYFVTDTNVLIRNINLIKQLAESNLRDHSVIIMIPWQVLKELDKLKIIQDKCVACRARKASRFLFESQNNGLNIIFQKQTQHFEDCPQVRVEVPDDHLIKSCCQLMNENKKVILLSNDINLRVKATATTGIPSVSDEWVSNLIQKDSKPINMALHCFENEPDKDLDVNKRMCFMYLFKLTLSFKMFLFNVLSAIYKKKYGEVWLFWLPSYEMTLLDNIMCSQSLAELASLKNQMKDIFLFYKENRSYSNIKAAEVERLGRHCIKLANLVYHLFPELGAQFDVDIGFLKTGKLDEPCGYISACRLMAQNYLKRMEEKLNCSLDRFRQLVSKVVSQKIFISDPTKMLKEIDHQIVIANEACKVFLLLKMDNEIPLDCPEVEVFHKFLLIFLDIKIDEYTLPLFSSEDIVLYINQERANLYPAALHWLTEVRREFTEFKSILRQH